MKKSTKISLFISLALIVIGAVIVFISLWGVGFDMKKFSNMTFEMTDSFNGVHISEISDDIEIILSNDGKCKAICYDSDEIYHECNVNNEGMLMIFCRDDRAWYEKMNFFYKENEKIQIYLPDKEYEELAVHSVNGDVSVPNDFTFKNTSISTTNGNVNFKANVKEYISVTTTTGDINLDGNLNGEIGTHTVNGKIKVKKIINARSAGFESVNGNIEFYGDRINNIVVNSTNGSIKFGDVVSDRITMSTVNGTIKGIVLSSGDFSVYSQNGSVSCPKSINNGTYFRFETVNGDINIQAEKS